jgi:hypothetical protein
VENLSSIDRMGLSGLIVGLAGLAFGFRQYRDQKKAETRSEIAETRSKDAERNLEDIKEQLKVAKEDGKIVRAELKFANEKLTEMHEKSLTIAKARFPRNLNALVDFIDDAKGELAVMCDFIGYAMYSNVSGFTQYFEALQLAAERKVKIRLLLYGLDSARQAIENQLPAANYACERNSNNCRDYFDLWHEGEPIPNSYNEFRDTLLRDEEKLMAKLEGVNLKLSDHSFLTFAWIANQTDACIFAFKSDGEDEAGMTFLSKDTQISTEFQIVFDSEWEKAANPLYKGRW